LPTEISAQQLAAVHERGGAGWRKWLGPYYRQRYLWNDMSLKAAVEYVFSGPDLGRLRFRLGFGVSRGSENVQTPGPG
jgi:hypothetical protein